MARIVTFSTPQPDGPVVGSVSHQNWGLQDGRTLRDPIVATEKMWWRATGRLAYAVGVPFSAMELPLLVPDAEHEANMRAGITDAEAVVVTDHPVRPEPLVPVETRLITHAPETRLVEMDDDEPRRPGRPKLPRDSAGNVIR